MGLTYVAFAFAALAAGQEMPSSPVGAGASLGTPAASATPTSQAARTEAGEAQPAGPAGASGAQPGGTQGRSTAEGTQGEGERRICRRIVASRSHRYQRVCLTAEEWRRMDN